MNLGEILDNAVNCAIGVPYYKPAKTAALTPDEHERMEFLKDPQNAYKNCVNEVGKGYYGSARETATGFIVKRFAINDAYGMWLSFCMWAYHRGSGNAQLPRVFAICIPEDERVSSYGYALMEKLNKHDTIFDGRDREGDTYNFRDGLSDISMAIGYGRPIGGIATSQFERLFSEFLVLANKDNMSIGVDVHMGNVLFRNAGTNKEVAVVTDPVILNDACDDACADGSYSKALFFMRKMLSMVSMYKPAMWSELRSRTIIEATVQ